MYLGFFFRHCCIRSNFAAFIHFTAKLKRGITHDQIKQYLPVALHFRIFSLKSTHYFFNPNTCISITCVAKSPNTIHVPGQQYMHSVLCTNITNFISYFITPFTKRVTKFSFGYRPYECPISFECKHSNVILNEHFILVIHHNS